MRMKLKKTVSTARYLERTTNVLKRCRRNTTKEIGRLRALQNDLHYNRLYIRERRRMQSKWHYLCMRRNYNNCAVTYVYVCAFARAAVGANGHCKTRVDAYSCFP